MSQFDWSRFSLKIYVGAAVPQVYEAWATRAGLEKWFLRKAEFTQPNGDLRENNSPVQTGDQYEWLWHGHPDSTVEHGSITEENGADRLQFTFGEAGVVTVHLKQVGNATEIVLTQDKIPDDERGRQNYHVGCSTGWTFYLANIKSVLEGGADLRNKNMEYRGVINS